MIRARDFGTLLEHWNGTAWSAASVDAITGAAARLTSVVDLGTSDAWAAGTGASGEWAVGAGSGNQGWFSATADQPPPAL